MVLQDVLFCGETAGSHDALGLLVDVVVQIRCRKVGLVSGGGC